MLLSGSGSLYIHRDGKTLPSIKNATEARLSTDGRKIVFVRAGDLYVATVEDGAERRLTHDATEGLSNGLAEYIAQEEMHRMEGFWISPDAHAVAYIQVDERHIPELRIPLLAKGPGAFESHRYPFTGAANARVRLGVVRLEGGETRWFDLGNPEYIARVTWDREGRLLVQTQPRDQRLLQLWRVNAGNGEKTLLLEERSESWVNLHDDLRPQRGGSFLWTSERSGYRHIYLYEQDGSLKKQLTSGDWALDRILATPADGQVIFTAGNPDPRQRQIFSVAQDGTGLRQLSQSPGMHDGLFHRSGKLYLDIFESRTSPPSVTLRQIDGTDVTTIQAPAAVPALPTPELITLPGADGMPLYGALFRPKDRKGPLPLVVAVYGGPHSQTVSDSWGLSVDMRAQYLAEQGFVVLKLDNRGMARRGTRFEDALYRKMGTVEVEDQVRGVQFLVKSGIADPARVGVYGWSYGGYLALLCLAKA
ncbi:MAG TPA: DPP IV N-terminal domain-containing protein, partial [Myxococcota bacterium]|nr:DPP IV N-terminal domain-containing protein [Myxococcota bacterium]